MAEKDKRDQPSAGAQLATFGGVAAAVALANKGVDGPLKAIRKAEELRKSGATRRQIHAETSKMLDGTPYAGVTYGADKQPRFEIDDSGASLRRAAIPSGGGSAFSKDVLDHPELYKAYPSAAHLTVSKNDKPGSQIGGGKIKLSPRRFAKTPLFGREVLNQDARGHMVHELQHYVQDVEGHAPGGTPSDFDKHPKWGGSPEKQELAYRMLAGEQEATLTTSRQHMTAAQRRATMPVPEVPEAHQIVLKPGEGVRARLDLTSLTDAARSALDAIRNKDVAEGKAIRYRKVDPARVNVDAKTFQFKSGGDAAGVTDRLRDVKTWDPVAAGKSIMWERADGKLFVGDGHQRTGLAKRLQSEGQAGLRMDAAVLRERDGWSARDVRVFAAMKNIKEGSGTSLDMAKVMRERPDLVNNSLPLSDGNVRDAVALSKLSPDAFGMVINGVVKPEHAAAVASLGDSSRHASMLSEMAKAEIASAQHARIYVQQAMAAPQYTETTGSLFGEETQTRSLLTERAKVLDRAIQALKSDKKIFGLLEREAGQIEAAGNKLAHDVNAARAEGAGRTAELVEKLALNRGPVSDMLDQAARAVAEGEPPAKAARGFVRSVHDTLKAGGMSGLMGDAPKAAPAPIDPNQANMFGGSGERPGWSDEARNASADVRAKGAKVKKQTRVKAMMDSELPPRLGKGRTTAAAQAKWEKEFRAIPQDNAEKKLLSRKKGERIGRGDAGRVKAMADDDMFGGPSTKDKIAAAARAKEAKGRTGDPMDVGLFGSSKDQTDLVDMAKEKPAVTKDSIIAKHKKDMARIDAKHARAERGGKKAADMAKIKGELREMFARDPNGKQRNTKGELLPVRKGAEDVALKGGELTAVINGKRTPVQSWEQLSSAMRNTIDATGVGASQTPPVRVIDTSGKVIANVSYNGKVWAGDVGTWKSGDKPLYDPSGNGSAGRVDGLRSGDMEMLKRTIKSGGGETVSARHADLLKSATNAQLSELDTFAHEARKGSARTDVDFNRIGAFRQQIRDLARAQSDAAAKAQIEGKGPAGWSDAARAASAEARAADAKAGNQIVDPIKVMEKRNETARAHAEVAKSLNKSGQIQAAKARAAVGLEMVGRNEKDLAKLAKPLLKDPAVKELLKKGLVTKADVKGSKTMASLQALADKSKTLADQDRGIGRKPKPLSPELQAAKDAVANPNVEAVRNLKSKAMAAKRKSFDPAAHQPEGSGLRGTQNEANLKAILENRAANAMGAPALTDAARAAGVKDPAAQMKELFGKPASSSPSERLLNRIHAGRDSGVLTTEEANAAAGKILANARPKRAADLKAKFAEKMGGAKGKTSKAVAILAPVGIAAAMLTAANQAKAEGLDRKAEAKEAAKAGVTSGAVMAGFTIGAGAAVKGLMKAGVTAVRAAPMVQAVMMAGGAVYEGVSAYREGGSAKDIALAAGKGAWDMSLPGMVVNTARDVSTAVADRKALEETPRVAGLQRFHRVAQEYKERAAQAAIVAASEKTDGEKPRGWANPKVQAAAQEAKGRKFSGVFKDGSHGQMQQ